MAQARFFLDGDLIGEFGELDEQESSHAVRSRRLKQGDPVELFNGRGVIRRGTLGKTQTKNIRVWFTAPPQQAAPSKHGLYMAVSPPKRDRMSFMVEKLSELGVDGLLPTLFKRSPDGGVKAWDLKKLNKWRRAVIESAKQCFRSHLMAIEPCQALHDLEAYDLLLLLSLDGDARPIQTVLQDLAPKRTLFLIGPEGGFTPEETRVFQEKGAQLTSLNQNILRVETAALACAAIFRSLFP